MYVSETRYLFGVWSSPTPIGISRYCKTEIKGTGDERTSEAPATLPFPPAVGSPADDRLPKHDQDHIGNIYIVNVTVRSMLDNSQYDIGLGTYSLTGTAGTEIINRAIEAGYRHIDTARLYGNETEVGEAIEQSTVDGTDLFVATKIAHFEEADTSQAYIRDGISESRERLGVDSIDLLYHHWPRGSTDIDDVLPVFERFVDEGMIDRIGVSNYTIEDIEHARELIDVPLYANQVEMHPLLQQDELHEFCREQGMYVVAYAPLAQGRVFDVPQIRDIAEKHDTTPASVSLAWLRSRDGVVVIPRTSSVEHLIENRAARELELDDEDIARIESIDETHRCEDPDWMEW